MIRSGLAVGLVSGLVLALILIAGASALGPAALHIDLRPVVVTSTPATGSSLAGQTIGADNTAPALSFQPRSFSSLSSLATDGTTSLAILLVPLVLGVTGGAVLYSFSTRRIDAE